MSPRCGAARLVGDRGAVAVETALLLSLVLVPLLLGTVDASRAYVLSNQLAAAAREGAALAQTFPGRVSCGNGVDSITTRVRAESTSSGAPAVVTVTAGATPVVGCSDVTGIAPGASVSVRAAKSFTPLFGVLAPATITLHRTTTVTVQGA